MNQSLNIVILGLSITSSWGNGHATTFRSLVKGLKKRGHEVTFLERDMPWYANNRDLPNPDFCKTHLYSSLDELKSTYASYVSDADAVIVGSYVPDGVEIGQWVKEKAHGVVAFYDIDTPVTLDKLKKGDFEYVSPEVIPLYDIYMSFAGGPVLDIFKNCLGAKSAKALYCSVDPDHYYPETGEEIWDFGYLGTYSPDRQPPLETILMKPATMLPYKQFVVAGPQFPEDIKWVDNIERIDHLPPHLHRSFYNNQRFTCNITRASMKRTGYSPSVRLFEAAACATPVISDYWQGLDELFMPGKEILISNSPADTVKYLTSISKQQAEDIGLRAYERVMKEHTGYHRAGQLAEYILQHQKEGVLSE